MPGAFKLYHLQLIQPLLFRNFFHIFHLHTGEPILITPEGQLSEKGILPTQNWMGQMVSSAWGIQTGPFAAHSAPFVLKLFHLFHLHTGEPILITPEG